METLELHIYLTYSIFRHKKRFNDIIICIYLHVYLKVRRQDCKHEKSWHELVSLGAVGELQCVYSTMQQLVLHFVSVWRRNVCWIAFPTVWWHDLFCLFLTTVVGVWSFLFFFVFLVGVCACVIGILVLDYADVSFDPITACCSLSRSGTL